MIKKIFISIGVLFSFFLMFLFGFDKINILAYTPVNNTIGTYPLQLDIDNYNRENLFDNDHATCGFTYMTNCNISKDRFSIYIDVEAINPYGYAIITDNIRNILETNKTYTFTLFTDDNSYFYSIALFDSNSTLYAGSRTDYTKSITYSFSDDYPLYIGVYTDPDYLEYNIVGIMITEGTETPSSYSGFFKFGYNVGYGLKLFNQTNNSQTTDIQIRDENNNILLNNSVTLSANSNTFFSPNSFVYIPFNIDKNGRFSFNKTLNLYFTNTNIEVDTTSDIDNPFGIYFALTYSAYYKGEYTNKLHFKNTYLLNNISINGVSLNLSNSTINDSSLIMTGIILSKSNYDNWYTMSGTSNSGPLVEGLIENVSTNRIIETGYYNSLDFNYFDNNAIYSFIIDNPSANGSTSILNDTYITINISSFNARVIGSNNVSPPTSSDSNTIGKYNKCEAWYDIPCQLGNAITYVIYEAPIISPVLTFVVSFITMFSSLVSFVDLFRSFGIVFGCFIIYMFIELLHKYSK